MNRYMLAVDPALKSGWALFCGRDLVASGTLDLHKASGLWAIRMTIQNILRDAATNLRLLAIEEPWGMPGRKSTRVQDRIAGAWEASVWGPELEVLRIAPATWQARILGLNRGRRGFRAPARRNEIKAASGMIASGVAKRPLAEDEADAVCIGLCALGQLGYAEAETLMERRQNGRTLRCERGT